MIGLNEDLRQRERDGTPVAIGLIGAGQMGTDVVAQVTMMAGIEIAAVADIDLGRAGGAYRIGRMQGDVAEAATAHEADEAEKLVPVGLAIGATVLRSIGRDVPITLDDVALKEPSTVLTLRQLQDAWCAGKVTEESLLASVNELAAGGSR